MIKEKPSLKNIIDYNTCSRANIFRREQGNITDLNSFKTVLRYNNYLKDEYSYLDPTLSISARGDLPNKEGKSSCFGAYDAKVAKMSEINGNKKTVHIISGPTTNFDYEPLNFGSDGCKNMEHHGIMDVIDFDWTNFTNKFPME